MPESNVFNRFELSLSEKQIPRFVGNVSSYKEWTELLESNGVRPRQARYQAALRPDSHIHSKGLAALGLPGSTLFFLRINGKWDFASVVQYDAQ